jgi:hypothetical protein
MDEYQKFIDKFKPKKTTDDCYTPANVYDAVLAWVTKEYNLQGRKIIRPFYPGGDYENYDYPVDCVVVDNPPFSILQQIKDFYNENNIDYFLFAPSLTMFNGANREKEKFIITNAAITYENGAVVSTSFATNMGEYQVMTAPELKKMIDEVNTENKKTTNLPKYSYPDNLISSARLGKLATVDLKIKKGAFVRQLDSQKEKRKTIFGGGLLISNESAKAIREAEEAIREETITWELSDREWEIISKL